MEEAGLINMNKPVGISSYRFIERIKNILKARKIGHAGSLDPLASGVLLVLLNKGTRLFQKLLGLDKEYQVVAKLGEKTDTWDKEGKVIARRAVPHFSKEEIQRVLDSFQGNYWQPVPPYSAAKLKGKPRYFYARQGIEIPSKKSVTKIYRLKLLKWQPPFLSFKVRCSSGTYIRSLVHDLGEKLGTGATTNNLLRLSVGPFSIKEAHSLDDLKEKRFHFYKEREVKKLIAEFKGG